MINIRVELWLLPKEKLDEDFKALSGGKSAIEIKIDEGTSVTKLFKKLAELYGTIEENIFDKNQKIFHPNLILILNNKIMSFPEVYEKRLKDGDEIKVTPIFIGG